jgi:signal transduction histidine kinase
VRDGDRVRLFVRDSGPGVRDEVRNTLFQPFVTTKPHGAGLGLYVCRQIVERSGGTLGYETTPTGATFWCDLPAAEATAAAPDPDRS